MPATSGLPALHGGRVDGAGEDRRLADAGPPLEWCEVPNAIFISAHFGTSDELKGSARHGSHRWSGVGAVGSAILRSRYGRYARPPNLRVTPSSDVRPSRRLAPTFKRSVFCGRPICAPPLVSPTFIKGFRAAAAKFSFQVQHRYASELRWEFTMVSSTLMSVTSFIVSGSDRPPFGGPG